MNESNLPEKENLLDKIDISIQTQDKTTKQKVFTQQLFHPGLFNRARSSSLSDITQNSQKHTLTNMESSYQKEQINDTTKVTWQKVPEQKQKRTRSPNEGEQKKITKLPRTNKSREQALNKSRGINFDPPSDNDIGTTNSFSGLELDCDTDSNIITEISSKKKPSKPPPIILYGIQDVTKLTNCLEEVANENDYSYKIITKNELIISTKSIEKYKIMIEHIRSKGLIGHTFTNKSDRCPRFVIKKLHSSTPKDEIVKAIEATGNKVKGEIITARKRGTKEPIDMFFVNILPGENNRLIKDIKTIYHQVVVIEDPKREDTIVQCTRCQQYGHTKNNCMRPYRCVKCAGPHKTTSCTLDDNSPAVCALCSGSHPASYKNCRVYKEIMARKKNKIKTKQTHREKIPAHTQELGWERIPETHQTHSVKSNSEILQTYSEVAKRSNHSQASNGVRQTTNTYVDESKSQRTHRKDIHIDREQDSNLFETRYNKLEELFRKQAEKIDQLIALMGTMLTLITKLVEK